MPLTNFKQKSLLFLSSIIAAVIIAEIVLRLSGHAFLFFQERRNIQSYKNKDTYRVVCIGESTTALGGENSYPRQLEKILNQNSAGVKFSVINKGIPSINTTAIISNLKGNILWYEPDMLVVMMGINDIIYGTGLYAKDTNTAADGIYKSLQSMRVVKLYNFIRYGQATNPNIKKRLPDFLNGRSAMRTEEEMEKRRIVYAKDKHCEMLVKKGVELYAKGKYAEAEKIFLQTIAIHPDQLNPYMELNRTLIKLGRTDETESVYKRALEKNPHKAWGASGLAHFYEIKGNEELADKFSRIAEGIRERYSHVIVRENFRRLKAISDEHNVAVTIVQYPMRDIKPLKEFFNGQEDIVFVDNKKSFRDAVRIGNYDKYFYDSFAGDFGHCTAKGNRLLAENVAKAILGNLGIK